MATAINSGFRAEIFNVAVSDSTWTPVTLTDKMNNLCIRCREDDGTIKVALDDSGTTYFTIPTGTAFTIDWYPGKDTPVYLQCGVLASATAEVFCTYA